MPEFSNRLRALRQGGGLTLEQLAQRSGLTKSYLSKLERAVSEPSISTVLKLADAFGVEVSALIAVSRASSESVSVVRAHERQPLSGHGTASGNRYETLAGHRADGTMHPFIVYPPHKGEGKPAVFPHRGEEFMFVMHGTAAITVGGETHTLGAGDTIYFSAKLPHELFSVSEDVAQVLVVTSASADGL